MLRCSAFPSGVVHLACNRGFPEEEEEQERDDHEVMMSKSNGYGVREVR
jgi:hypothetical protein